MLAPSDRRLLLDVLAPPEGHRLDQALGTTYTLDLLALLRVPLAATALPWAGPAGAPVENPFSLLVALRENASRISLYCHAGATKVPARHIPLLAFLEEAVHPVTPPHAGGVFHPKLWVLRFVPEHDGDPVRYRLLVLSRNLTFDRSWDTALALDGELLARRRGLAVDRPLADFVLALPAMARAAGHELSPAASARAALLGDELRRIEWSPPAGFDDVKFHPIGHNGHARWPVSDLHRLMVVSPFVRGPALARLRAEVRAEMTLVSRFDELSQLDAGELAHASEIDVFDDQAMLLDIEEDSPAFGDAPELNGLHAKLYVGERSRRAVVYVGSANATHGAFERNVEFLVELSGSRGQHGIDAVRAGLRDAGLLTPFKPGPVPDIEEQATELRRRLERVAHALAAGGLRAAAHPAGESRWRMTLHRGSEVSLDGLRLEARPLSDQTYRRVDLAAEPSCRFPPAGLSSVTAFFALRVSGRADGVELRLDVTARLPLEGGPDGRAEAVTAELLSDRERLVRFILLLLADEWDTERTLHELTALLTDERIGGSSPSQDRSFGLPLLEPMLRALHHAPERLDDIERLLADLRTAGGSIGALLPPELEALWSTIAAVRRMPR